MAKVDHDGTSTKYTICFAGREVARLFSFWNKEVADAPWYKGAGRPDDFPEELDIWVWGGISLVTERIMLSQRKAGICTMLLVFVVAFASVFGSFEVTTCLTAMISTICGYWSICVYHALAVSRAVEDIFLPKLLSLGFTIQCHQRPWFSYYTIQQAMPSTHHLLAADNAIKKVKPVESHVTAGGDLSLKLLAITSLDLAWDSAGYTNVLLLNHHQTRLFDALLTDVWTWGGLMETTRGRVRQIETTSPFLVEIRRVRTKRSFMMSFGTGCLWAACIVMLAGIFMSKSSYSVEWTDWVGLSSGLQMLLTLAYALSFCAAGRLKPPSAGDPLIIEAVKEAVAELGLAFQQKTGFTLEVENEMHPLPIGGNMQCCYVVINSSNSSQTSETQALMV